jgi:hypothetical protein
MKELTLPRMLVPGVVRNLKASRSPHPDPSVCGRGGPIYFPQLLSAVTGTVDHREGSPSLCLGLYDDGQMVQLFFNHVNKLTGKTKENRLRSVEKYFQPWQ